MDGNNGVVLMSANMLPESNDFNLQSCGNPRPISPNHSSSPTHSTIDNLLSQPLVPVPGQENQSVIDGTVEAHIDLVYKNTIPPTYTNGDVHELKITSKDILNGHKNLHSMDVVEKYHDENNHNEKSHSSCTRLNKLCLFLAILCFALFLGALTFIIAHIDKVKLRFVL
ncbi:unnamed protein product [Didymodactylos carnosus]|nr:unnamed protein product [Didymodactylos carnosus]CAF3744915.1 unnamed protein product [Didymodactylos carnosus]